MDMLAGLEGENSWIEMSERARIFFPRDSNLSLVLEILLRIRDCRIGYGVTESRSLVRGDRPC